MTDALPPGYQLQIYRIVKVLGQGGFGITYRAEDTKHGGFVALKEFLPNQLAHREGVTIRPNSQQTRTMFETYRSKFLDEATALLHFRHLDNIVNIQAFFQANGTAYLVMDFIAGTSLAQHLRDLGRPPAESEVRAIVLPLLDDLGEVHAAGYLHRDIKPQNILIRPDGSPVLIDFGAARQAAGYDDTARTLTAFISDGYTPPEQYVRDGDQGPWTDLYALGAVAYRMITGGKPPSAPSRLVGKQDCYVPARAATDGRYSVPLLTAIDWALERYAENRPPTAAAWRAAFDGSAAADGIATPPRDPTVPQTPTDDSMAETVAGLAGSTTATMAATADRRTRTEGTGRSARDNPDLQRSAAEQDAWKNALIDNTRDGYQNYLDAFPQGVHRGDAQTAIDRLEQATRLRAADDAAWQAALRVNTGDSYAHYLSAYHDGYHSADARIAISRIDHTQAGRHSDDKDPATPRETPRNQPSVWTAELDKLRRKWKNAPSLMVLIWIACLVLSFWYWIIRPLIPASH